MIKWYVRNVQYCTVSALLFGMVAVLTFACSTAGTGTGTDTPGRTEKVAIDVAQSAGSPGLSVSWPQATGSFDKYVVQVASEDRVVRTETVAKEKTEVVIPLPNGKYNVQVFLKTKADSDEKQEYSISTTATVAGVQAKNPSIPSDVQVTFPAGDDAVKTIPTITWKAPVDFGKKEDGTDDSLFGTDGGKITDAGGYTIYWAETGAVSTVSVLQAELALPAADGAYKPEELKYSITNLQAGHTYYAIVAVKNTGGLVAVSDRKEIKVPVADANKAPTAPEPATALGLDNSVATQLRQIALKWTAPTGFGTTDGTTAATVSEYIVYYKKYYKKGDALSPDDVGRPKVLLWASAGTATTKVVTSLDINQSYTFMVETKNSAGQKSYSDSFRTTSPAKPAAATEPAKIETISGTPSAHQIALTWQAPDLGTTDGTTASKLIEYRIYWKQDNDWKEGEPFGDLPTKANATTQVTQFTATALQADQQYVFVIVTKTNGGQTGMSQSDAQAFKTPPAVAEATAPAAPTEVEVNDGITKKGDASVKVTVSWKESANAGTTNGTTAASITGYTIYWAEGDTVTTASANKHVAGATATSYTITGLKGAQTYAVIVVAKNNAGKEATSDPTTIETKSLETDPTASIDKLTPEANPSGATTSITVTWSGSAGRLADGTPAEISGYTVYWAKGSTVTTASANKDDPPASPYTITGLKGEQEYAVIVVAKTNNGNSPASAKQTATTGSLAIAPTAPVINDKVELGKSTDEATATLKISWTASTPGQLADGTPATISGYTVYWAKGSTVTTASANKDDPPASPYTITGLKGEQEYAVIVVAKTNNGNSPASAKQTATTGSLAIAPTAPVINDKVELGKSTDEATATLKISWTASTPGQLADGTPATISGYTVYWAKGSTVTTASANKDDPPASPYTITGLKGEQEYAVIVVAKTNNGNSPASAKQTATTGSLAIAPTAPVINDKVELGKSTDEATATLKISWTASTPGQLADGTPATISGYTVYWAKGSTVTTASANKDDPPASPYTITGLKGEQEYAVIVVAKTNNGNSPASAKQTATTGSLAIAPTAPVINDKVELGKSTDEATATLKISWTASTPGQLADGTPATISGYTVYWAKGSTVTTASANKDDPPASPYTITGLKGEQEYAVIVVAKTNNGNSPASAKQTATTGSLAIAPTAPVINDKVELGKSTDEATATLKISWTASTPGQLADGTPVTISGYTVYWAKGSTVTTASANKDDPPASPYTITGLKGEQEYTVIVVAKTNNGNSPASATKTATTGSLKIAPTAPTVTLTPEAKPSGTPKEIKTITTSITVTWSGANAGRLADGTKATISGYTVYWAGAGHDFDWTGKTLLSDPSRKGNENFDANKASHTITNLEGGLKQYSQTITGLKGLKQYSVVVVTNTDTNESSPGRTTQPAITTTSTLHIPPEYPNTLTRTGFGSGEIIVGWSDGEAGRLADGTKATIIGYTVYWRAGKTVDTSSNSHPVDTPSTGGGHTIRNLPSGEYAIKVGIRTNNGFSIREFHPSRGVAR